MSDQENPDSHSSSSSDEEKEAKTSNESFDNETVETNTNIEEPDVAEEDATDLLEDSENIEDSSQPLEESEEKESPLVGEMDEDMFDNLTDVNIDEKPEKSKKSKRKEPTEVKKNPRKMTAGEKRRFDRFYELQIEAYKSKQAKIKKKQLEKEEELMKEVTFKPIKFTKKKKDINEEKRSPHELRQGLLIWNQERLSKRKDAKNRKELEEMKEVTFKPKISDESRKILENSSEDREYKDPVAGWKERFRKFQEKRRVPKVDKSDFSPKLSKKTKEITKDRSDAPIHERLYVDSIAMSREREKKYQKLRNSMDGEAGMIFQPNLNSTKIGKKLKDDVLRDKHNVFEDLFHKSKLMLKKKEDLINKRKDELDSHDFSPKISRISREIAKISSKRKPLYISPKDKSNNQKEKKTGSPNSVKSFSGSEKEVSRKFNALYESQVEMQRLKERKIREIKEERIQKELSNCSFQPSISKKTKTMLPDYKFDYGRHKPKKRIKDSRFVGEDSPSHDDEEKGNVNNSANNSSGKMEGGKIMWRIVKKNPDEEILEEKEEEEEEKIGRTDFGGDSTKQPNLGKKKSSQNIISLDQIDDDKEIEDEVDKEIEGIKVKFEEMGEIEEDIDTAFEDWEKLSSNFDF